MKTNNTIILHLKFTLRINSDNSSRISILQGFNKHGQKNKYKVTKK